MMNTAKILLYSSIVVANAFLFGTLGVALCEEQAQAEQAEPTPQASGAPDADSEAERVNVDTIKEKYWARGDQSELGVVQNRAYTKEGKWELGVFGAIVSTDPFLSVYAPGMTFGYHFSEYFAVQALYIKDFVGASSALSTLRKDLTSQNNGNSTGADTSTNPPRYYAGGEMVYSVLYGKLSVFGKAIIYYDLNLLGGLGMMDTNNGNYVTEEIGLGQQVYLSKHVSVKLDYRLLHYNETIYDTVLPPGTPDYHQDLGNRSNWTNVFALGFSFMFGEDAKDRDRSTAKPGAGGTHP